MPLKPANTVVPLKAGSINPLRLEEDAPVDWTGRVQVSFVLADAVAC